MGIGDYLRIVRRYWWVAVVVTLMGGGIGYALAATSVPMYESTARLFVSTQGGTSVGEAYQNNLFSQERVVSYAGLATSEQVAARAANQLKTGISTDDLRSRISAHPVDKTVLLDIAVRDHDPSTAQMYANAVSDQLVEVISELETSRRGGSPAAGVVVVDDATYPQLPIGPTVLARILLGVAGGLAAGLVLTILVGLLDTRLRRTAAAQAATDSLVLATLPTDPGRATLEVADLDSGGPYVERLAELCTNLQFARTADGGRPHVLAVTSAQRGEGRTTVVIDLAAALTESGHRVVVVDADLPNPALAKRLGLTAEQLSTARRRGLSTVLAGQHDVATILIPDAGGHGFSLVPAGPVPKGSSRWWPAGDADDALAVLRDQFDYVLIDTPPLALSTEGAFVAGSGDGALVVVRLGRTRLPALRRAIATLRATHTDIVGTVATFESGHRRKIAEHRRHLQRSSAQAPSTDNAGTPDAADVAAEPAALSRVGNREP